MGARAQPPQRTVKCAACGQRSVGRLFAVGWTEPLQYCTKCPNLRMLPADAARDAVQTCRCGGRFESNELRCPRCEEVIGDAERQLALQHYVVDPAHDPKRPTEAECEAWYQKMVATRALGGVLFVQLRDLLMCDPESGLWKYYALGEV